MRWPVDSQTFRCAIAFSMNNRNRDEPTIVNVDRLNGLVIAVRAKSRMEAAEPIVRRRRVRQFRTTEEKRLIVEETRRLGVSVSTVAQAQGINTNQVFYWRKLYEAGQLESTVAQPTGDLGARGVRLLHVSVDEGAERQTPV
jgi:transposase-like protein